VSNMSYAVEGISVNEFMAPRWQKVFAWLILQKQFLGHSHHSSIGGSREFSLAQKYPG
jgi:hypothetical protein